MAIYSLGVINPLQALENKNLQVDGVQNRVQYLTSLVISGSTNKVEFRYDEETKSVIASGSLNMQNIVVWSGNEASVSAVVFWWTGNNSQGENSVVVWGSGVVNNGQNTVILSSFNSVSNASNTAIVNGTWVATEWTDITILNGSENQVQGNSLAVFWDSSVSADNSVVFGDRVTNDYDNTFIFNGKDAEFKPKQDSAFYANSKVAINTDHAKATLDVAWGVMIDNYMNGYTIPQGDDPRGVITLFARKVRMNIGGRPRLHIDIGLCGYNGKNNQRSPLSESARKFWLCTGTQFVELPRNAVTNDTNRDLPGVWNQEIGRWQKGLWVYGSKSEKGHFLCADGFVPDNSDPIGKTGVECIACQWAKSGDLNCKTEKKPDLNKSCPPEATYNETSKECERVTICTVEPGKKGKYDPNKTIEAYRGGKWVVTKKCQLTCPAGYEKKVDSISNNEYCELARPKKCIPELQIWTNTYEVILDNATLVWWDNQWLTEDTPITLIDSIYGVYSGSYTNDGSFFWFWKSGQKYPIWNSQKKCEYRCKQWYKPVLIRKRDEQNKRKRVLQCIYWAFDFRNNENKLDFSGMRVVKYNPEYNNHALYHDSAFGIPEVSYDKKTKITSIGAGAFTRYDNTNRDNKPDDNGTSTPKKSSANPASSYLSIPESITHIGADAFYNQKFNAVVIRGEGIETISENAFKGLGLKKIINIRYGDTSGFNKLHDEHYYSEFPRSLKKIWNAAFADNNLSGALEFEII